MCRCVGGKNSVVCFRNLVTLYVSEVHEGIPSGRKIINAEFCNKPTDLDLYDVNAGPTVTKKSGLENEGLWVKYGIFERSKSSL